MIELTNNGFEIYNDDDLKIIKGININREFIEIRFQNKWLDVTACKTEFGSKRCIFRKEMTEDMNIDDMMKYFDVIVR